MLSCRESEYALDSIVLQAPQQLDLLRPEAGVERLQNHGNMVESTIVHDVVEHGHTERSLLQAVVSIHPAGELFLAAIEVHTAQVLEPHGSVELCEHLFTIVSAAQVIT